MKNLIIFLLIILGAVINTQAQITGGGSEKQNSPNTPEKKEKNAFNNSFYITLVRPTAKGVFGNNSASLTDARNINGGMGKGVGINFGQVFYLNEVDLTKIGLPENIKLGIDATYASWVFCNENSGKETGFFYNSTHFFSTKLGAVISYNPASKLIIEAKFNLQPCYVIYDNEYNLGPGEYGWDEYSYVGGEGIMVRKGFGLYVRYKPFALGFETSGGKISVSSDSHTNPAFTIKMPTNRFDLVLGFSF